jgi:hypothetical protein
MVSGHVKKGDAIDLPVPYHESWPRLITFLYTGSGEMTAEMAEIIAYLGGGAQ